MDLPVKTRPFSKFEWLIASRYLRSRRKETFISVIAALSFLGILLGVATLIIVMAVMNGFRTELLSRILGINGHFVVQPMDGARFSDYQAIAKRIEGVGNIIRAVPFIEGQVLARGAREPTGSLVRGLDEAEIRRIPLVADNVTIGTFQDFEASKGIALGSRLAIKLGVSLGDKVTLIAPEGNVTAFGVTPRVKAYPVAAIFEIGMSEYDSALVIMPLKEAQAYFNRDDTVDALEVFTTNPDLVGVLRPKIEEAVDRSALITDWRQRNQTFFSALEVERNVMFIILTLIILVAALNIISGLTMLVKDKGRDIAILRTMGASRGSILRIFLITGAAIGTFGTFAGLISGVLIAHNIEAIRQFVSRVTQTTIFPPEHYFLSQLPSEINFGEVVSVVLLALFLSFLATLYPAWRAARLDPVEALRYE
ncbi:MAG: lipoprotein-releasing ABC transporter permease subunit [Rhizobiales bacterium]|nr:lipoprotein-releasing ABC transporter permease subunit [Hyphomicrobiales bacterium]